MDNPEYQIAEEFGFETDPLAKFNEKMSKFDTDWYDYYYQEYIDNRDIVDETKDQIKRSYQDWCEFMYQFDRHPTLPNENHVEAYVDELIEKVSKEVARRKINHVKEVYEWMQANPRFPHPTNYNPFLLIKNKRKADLSNEDPDDHPNLSLDDIERQVKSIKHIGERAMTVTQLKLGIRSTELANIRLDEIHITNADVLAHYDGREGQNHGPMGSHDKLEGISNAVYIPHDDKRPGNKRKMPTIIPLDDETRQVLIDWLLIRPDNGDPHLFLTQKGKPLDKDSLRYIWSKHWLPEYKFEEEDEVRSISPHYSRHWFSTWFRTKAEMAEPKVQYLRGEKMSSEFDGTRSAFHRYVHTRYADVEDEYRSSIFKLGL